MITQPTQHDDTAQETLNGHGDALDALVALRETFGYLPRPHISIYCTTPFTLQLGSPEAFEQYRAVLDIDPASVQLHDTDRSEWWLSAEGSFCGVALKVTGFGIQPSVELDESPQAVAA